MVLNSSLKSLPALCVGSLKSGNILKKKLNEKEKLLWQLNFKTIAVYDTKQSKNSEKKKKIQKKFGNSSYYSSLSPSKTSRLCFLVVFTEFFPL